MMETDPSPYIVASGEIESAVELGQPVVALESTLISHGLPWPDNLEVALACEVAVRESGSIPATIAVMDGVARIGLTRADIEKLAKTSDAHKLSLADLPAALGLGQTGATTVAATMVLAEVAGLSVFATGGIGGVHRGAEVDFDISADLQQLARGNMLVVCAGAKAILDLPKTRELLETLGVTVLGYGTEALPAFWSRDSGLKADRRIDTPQQAVSVFDASQFLGLEGSVLIAQPIAAEAEIPAHEINAWLDEALPGAPGGKEATPYLLTRIAELSGGRTLEANKRLIVDNARLAGEIACKLSKSNED